METRTPYIKDVPPEDRTFYKEMAASAVLAVAVILLAV